jgi:tRNA-splicing ligase RtcB
MGGWKIERVDDVTWDIPRTGNMVVPGRIFASEQQIQAIVSDGAAQQVVNVACLPGIVRYSLAMPDAHSGYGFPIGGVAATDPDNDGVISPGGVGYDINCGVRLMTTRLPYSVVQPKLQELVSRLFNSIPCGVGSSGAIRKLSPKDMKQLLEQGSKWALEQGYGTQSDLRTTEESGCMRGADASIVSERAKSRGESQAGTLGSGNHFAELGVVDKVFDERIANVYGLHEGDVTFMIHSGSRGLGYQVCDDYVHVMMRAGAKYGIDLPDRQLCCAPVHSREGREYLAAMAAAANFAWANRQIMMHFGRNAIKDVIGVSDRELGAHLLYDVCHNIAKFEVHEVAGVRKRLCVHRKGATRAFPGGRDVPDEYAGVGQPVLIPGDMGTASYVCAGTDGAMAETFGSCCHGAGRLMSRTAAKKTRDGASVVRDLAAKQIVVMARSQSTLSEEMPEAYKNIDSVAEVVDRAGIGKRVARIRPIGVVKG